MGWERFLDELDAQMQLRLAESVIAQARDLAKIEASSVSLSQRLRAVLGKEIQISLRCGQILHLALQRVGKDWCYGSFCGQGVLIPLTAVVQLRGLGRVQETASIVDKNLSFGASVRRICGQVVQLRTRDGKAINGLLLSVWSDHLDLRTEAGDVTFALSEIDYLASGAIR